MGKEAAFPDLVSCPTHIISSSFHFVVTSVIRSERNYLINDFPTGENKPGLCIHNQSTLLFLVM
jgi:hypothetical protein